MKLTICQCCKLFLLLTAFSFFNSLKSVGLLAKQVVATTNIPLTTITISSTTATTTTGTATVPPTLQNLKTKKTSRKSMLLKLTSNTAKENPVTFPPSSLATTRTTTAATTPLKPVTKPTLLTIYPEYGLLFNTSVSASVVRASTSTSTTTTTTSLKSVPTSRAPTVITIKSEIEKPFKQLQQRRNARKTNARTTQRQQQRQQQQQQRQKQHLKQQQQQQTQLQYQQQRVGVLLSSKILDTMKVQQGFNDFVDFFQVNLKNISIDFLRNDDLSDFIKLLQHSNYTTVVKTLNVGINVDDDLVAVAAEGKPTTASAIEKNNHMNRAKNSSRYHVMADRSNNVSENVNVDKNDDDDDDDDDADNVGDSGNAGFVNDKIAYSDTDIGYCHLAEELSRVYNKSVILWPCSKIKESSNFLPSYEAISYAVKSIATKLNWTQVEIFVGDQNWGLPLAIAANLHIPYKIEIGSTKRDLHTWDDIGKAIIITADMNDDSTLRLLRQLATLQNTKILLIDMLATSFNAENRFYKNLERIKTTSQLMSNLLLLTVLSDKYRHFLNVAFDNNGIEMVQNFRQIRRWRAMNTKRGSTVTNWPIHLDSSVAQIFHHMSDGDVAASSGLDLIECMYWQNATELNFVEICQNIEFIVENCTNDIITGNKEASNIDVRSLLQRLCQLAPLQVEGESSTRAQETIVNLRNFIDFFNFYDFLIASVVQQSNFSSKDYGEKHSHSLPPHDATARRAHVAKYDFIVLDVVRGDSSASAFDGASNGDTTTTGSNKLKVDNNNNNIYKANNNSSSSSKRTSNNNSETFKWRPLLILEQHEINLNTYITHSVLPGYDDWLLASSSHLFQCGAICWTIVAISVGVLFIIVAASVAAGIAMRNYLLRKRLSKGPNKIVLSANDFVFPVDSRRVDEGIEAMLCCWLQQLQEFGGPEVDKPDLLKGSIGSLKNLGLLIPGQGTNLTAANGKITPRAASLARHNPALLDMRARYNGDLVQLKEISLNGSMELKSKAMDLLVMAHGLRHENINPLIGWLADPNRTAMVFDYCSRGSLQDVLIMDEIKLDWSFRLSLLTDLVRGMRYLHTSPLRVHGALSSRNCVVDARWVLKITDYGLASFYEAQGLNQMPRSAKELLWTAPELLRSMKTAHNQHHQGGRVVGTQMGDVYSFGIIMQEVVVRGEPYCMLSSSAEEIIAKIKKPPPLIRPSVSKGAAPPEAINIMRQCWAEQPDMRPDFNSVYERFKILNHGRKVNFVDTMFQMLEKYSNNLEELIRERTEQLDIERKKTEQLLNRMLPSSVAEKLKMGLGVDPEEFSDVTIYFSDIVGFTTIAAHCSPVQVVDLLNDLYTIFDATINAYNVYKVETIGDAYMVVSGLPVKIPDHAEQIATMALDLLHQSGRFSVKHLPGVPLQLRIGLHTGPCCAGVVGLTMPRYCLFGDTVNTASRMESSGSSWRIHMSQETRDRLEIRGGYMIEQRGFIEIKGKGLMNTFWLLGKKGFDKQLPMPPPIGEAHGLDECLIRNSITLKAQANKSRNSTNPSSSQSSSLAGESVEVKVEITPPTNVDICSSNQPNSYSIDSNSTNTISPNTTLCPEFPAKTPSASPQSRKMSELNNDTLLNPNTFNRLPNSTSGSSARLYKKIEEMMDLSSPYNHYKCLSPSESNLTQFNDSKYVYSAGGSIRGNSTTAHSDVNTSGGGSMHGGSAKFDSKPGSSRLLRRQFSLDRDDPQSKHDSHHQQHHQSSLQATHTMSLCTKSGMLDIPVLQDTARSPKIAMSRMIHKQNSNSIAQDLEKIEEIPLSPASSQHHSSLDSNLNRSLPSTLDTQFPQFPANTPPSPTAPTVTPAVMRSLSDGYCDVGSVSPSPPPLHYALEGGGTLESSTTDASTATTATASANSTNNTTPADEGNSNIRKTELTLNVEALMTR